MTHDNDELMNMAREAGLFVGVTEVFCCPHELRNFAKRVAAAEREACEQLCDELWQNDGTAYDCREAIRSRSKP